MTNEWIAEYSSHLDAGLSLASQGQHEAAISMILLTQPH